MELKVQLIATPGPPVGAILRGYYMTAVVNFISWNKAYSIFPRATLLFHETVLLTKPGDYDEPQLSRNLAKYRQRGWRLRTESVISNSPYHRHPLGDPDKCQNRRVGDSGTWVMRLGDTAAIEGSNSVVPDFVLEYSCFRIDGIGPRDHNTLVRMHNLDAVRSSLALTVKAWYCSSCVLRYEYTYGRKNEFWRKLYKMMEQDIFGQLLCKLPREQADNSIVTPARANLMARNLSPRNSLVISSLSCTMKWNRRVSNSKACANYVSLEQRNA